MAIIAVVKVQIGVNVPYRGTRINIIDSNDWHIQSDAPSDSGLSIRLMTAKIVIVHIAI